MRVLAIHVNLLEYYGGRADKMVYKAFTLIVSSEFHALKTLRGFGVTVRLAMFFTASCYRSTLLNVLPLFWA